MNKRIMPKGEQDNVSDEATAGDDEGAGFSLPLLGAALMSLTNLPKTIQDNPMGGFVVTGLIVLGLLAWVAVTWIKHR